MRAIFWVSAPPGRIGIMAAPGAGGDYAGDVAMLIASQPALVVSMTGAEELAALGAGGLGTDLAAAGIARMVLPVRDFGAPGTEDGHGWANISDAAHAALDAGKSVVVHCRGGCGRSGMAALRLLVERGEAHEAGLARLRAVRPCAVETAAQYDWAAAGSRR